MNYSIASYDTDYWQRDEQGKPKITWYYLTCFQGKITSHINPQHALVMSKENAERVLTYLPKGYKIAEADADINFAFKSH